MRMKQLFLSILFLVLSLQFAIAQTEKQRQQITSTYDLEYLQELSLEFSRAYKKDKREALIYAAANNIEVVKELDNGGISVLEKVLEDGTLIYISTLNAGAATTLNSNEVYSGGSSGLSLDGRNIVMGIWDGGIVRETHQELSGRVTQQDNPGGLSSHATHVAGTMIASGVDPNAKGMAFAAELKAYDFGNDFAEMTVEASNGLLVSNHSYGISPAAIPDSFFGAYLTPSANLDQLVYNAPYYLPVIAAGNSRNVPLSQGGPFNPSKNGFDLISGQNLSKNILCVANVLQVNNYVDASSVIMSSSSSWGPTDDGRIKPDISAKGTNTFSSIATNDGGYATISGTSMSAPSIAGSLGLLHQHYSNLYDGFLTAASMRALVIHTAREAGNGPGPDYRFGWGLMDTAEAANVMTNKDFTSLIEENTLNNNDTYTFTVDAVDTNTPLVATIAWSDPAGAVQSTAIADDPTPRLVNDLDIKIIAPDGSTEFLPWKLNVSSPSASASTGDNNVDNVEKIEIENASGQYTIEISHKGALQNLSQDYSLIVTGIAESEFAINVPESNLPFCSDEIANFDINVNVLDSFSGNITLVQNGLPTNLNASFSPSTLSGEGTTTLSIDNLDAVNSGNYPFTVVASSGGTTFDIDLSLDIESADPLSDIALLGPSSNQPTVLSPLLEWNPVPDALSYEAEVSTSSNFDVDLISIITEDTQLTLNELNSSETYYWRVRPVNECATGNYTLSTFDTKGLVCLPTSFSTDTPVDIISTTPNTVQSVINISGVPPNATLEDINVNLEMAHTWLADVLVSLTSPDGTSIALLNQPCGNLNDVDVIFDDKGTAQDCNGFVPPALLGTIIAEDKLSSFVGENINGDWTLTVQDFFNGDGGSVDVFGLEICYDNNLSIENQVLSQFSLYPNPSSGRVEVTFNQSLGQDVNVEIFDLNGRILKTFEVKNSSNNFNFNLNDLSSGIYFVKLKTQNAQAVKKLILK